MYNKPTKQTIFPSILKIQKLLDVSEITAETIRGFLNGDIETSNIKNSRHFKHCEILKVINKIIEEYGVEYIATINDDTFNSTIQSFKGLDYINTGNLYNNTVIYNNLTERFIVGCVADIIEKNQNFYI